MLNRNVNGPIAAIFQFDLVKAFRRCIFLHPTSHARSDVIVKNFVTTIHKSLLHPLENLKKLRQHLATQSSIVQIPCVLNILPAMLNWHVNGLIKTVIQFDLLEAFGRCVSQYLMSHARTDIIVKNFLATIVQDIITPYVLNTLPALYDSLHTAMLNRRGNGLIKSVNQFDLVEAFGRRIFQRPMRHARTTDAIAKNFLTTILNCPPYCSENQRLLRQHLADQSTIAQHFVEAFGRCTSLHQMSHTGTDVIVGSFLTTVHHSLPYSLENPQQLRQHLATQSAILQDIFIPFALNIRPAPGNSRSPAPASSGRTPRSSPPPPRMTPAWSRPPRPTPPPRTPPLRRPPRQGPWRPARSPLHTAMPNRNANALTEAIIQSDLMKAFRWYICLHRMSHVRTDVIVKNCLPYCPENRKQRRQHLATQGTIVQDILIFYVLIIPPAPYDSPARGPQMIKAIIDFNLVKAFGKCTFLHQMSHATTDVIVKNFLMTIHNCLPYCSSTPHWRRQPQPMLHQRLCPMKPPPWHRRRRL